MIEIVVQSLVLVAGLVVLSLSSEAVVVSSVKLSKLTRIKEMVLGMVFIAFATSIPELAVSANAIINGATGISIGNLIGSNIVDILLVVGICALITPLIIKRELLKNISSILIITSLFPLILVNIPAPSKIVGLALIVVFFVYVVNSLKAKRPIPAMNRIDHEIKNKVKQSLILILGLVGVIISSKFVVDSAVSIATILNIAQSAIGATIIAVGTSLPELAVSVKATLKKKYDLAVGNALGSCITNIGLILGLVLLVAPFEVNMIVFSDIVMFLIATNIMIWYFVVKGKIGRIGGIILLCTYIVFLISAFMISLVAAT